MTYLQVFVFQQLFGLLFIKKRKMQRNFAKKVGVAPDAAIMSFRQTSSQSQKTDTGGTLATLTTAINAAIDKKVQVINISVVSCLPPGAPPIDTREFDAAIQRAEERGIIIVAAAGNMGNNYQQGSVVYPAHHTMVVGVTATNDSYQPTEYSIESPHPTISAPGTVYVKMELPWENVVGLEQDLW